MEVKQTFKKLEMKAKISTKCAIIDGKLTIYDRQRFDKLIKGLANMKGELIFKEEPEFRSASQMGFYWGVLIPELVIIYNDFGNQYDANQVHRDLADQFLFVEKQHPITGKPFKKFLSLSKEAEEVNTEIMSAYIERIYQFSAQELNHILPESK